MSNLRYEIYEKFVFRIPAFPINHLNDEDLINDNYFKEAIYIASKDLYQIIYDREVLKFELLPQKLKNTILKYLLRAKSRCTPFGLFAGCGVGSSSNANNFILSKIPFSTRTRLDMGILFEISKKISEDTIFQTKILWLSNNSIFKIRNYSFRFITYNYLDSKRKYSLNSIEYTTYLDRIIEAAHIPINIESLTNLLVREGFGHNESKEYILMLIKNQILVPNDESFATSSDEPIKELLKRIENLEGKTKPAFKILNAINGKLKKIDTSIPGRDTTEYKSIENEISQLALTYQAQHLFQTDTLVNILDGKIGSNIYEAVRNGFSFLNRITNITENSLLEQFKKKFYSRYENEEIYLLEALDVDLGIGFSNINQSDYNINTLLDDINLKQTAPKKQLGFKNIIIEKLGRQNSFDEIVITDNDISHLPENFHDLPYSLSSLVEIVHAGNNNNDPMIIMRNASGTSAVKLIARFCQANEEIEKIAKEIIKFEENIINEDVILAEIVHLPQARTGNVIHRPILRQYEIPYMTNSLQSAENIIELSDLMISVKNGKKIILRSKKLNKEVIPILSSAHNYNNDALPIYKFLCSLYMQDRRNNLGFSWDPDQNEQKFFPRIIYKNVIISPAIWKIEKGLFNKLNLKTGSDFTNEASSFLRQKRIPNKVYICEGDNKLFIDFSDYNYMRLFFSEIDKKGATIEEYLFNHDDMLIKDLEGNIFNNQVIFNFYQKNQ